MPNRIFKFCTAGSRQAKRWKLETSSWQALADRLVTPIRTHETVAEYRAMTAAQRGAIKDIGGFVGGELVGGRRTIGAVKSRSLVCLDLDSLSGVTADDLTRIYKKEIGAAGVVYSTHSHRPEKARLRLIIPTGRDMTPDEYEPVCRQVAGAIGINYFDDTTFDLNRLMYWPSVASDGEFYAAQVEGDYLDVDRVLGSYTDWRDVAEWPRSDRQREIVQRLAAKQEDPLSKKGLIGAYCRVHYPIQGLLDGELSGIYSRSDEKGGRYTYSKGSTYGGVVVYDDRFIYSHHATDPAGGQLVNAFDLMRIHKYGHKDKDAKPGTPVNRLPSYRALLEDLQTDEATKLELFKTRQAEADTEFMFEGTDDWAKLLTYSKAGDLEPSISNIKLILDNDPRLKGRLVYNALANRAIAKAGLPWRQDDREHDWSDADESGLKLYMEAAYQLRVTNKLADAVNLVLLEQSYHPILEYLDGLDSWDGVRRVERLFIDYLGAEDNLYNREVAKLHLVAAVRRVRQPGCKYDQMVILAGPQGIGKSTLINKLAMGHFTDSLYTLRGKEAGELMQGAWHIEMGELSAMKKADRDQAKAFLSKQEDIYRVAYGKHTSFFKRQCVFWGSSNEHDFLRDPTGDRRSLPITCTGKGIKSIWDDLPGELDQIWAEASYLEASGYPLYLSGEAEKAARAEQEAYMEDNPLTGLVLEYLDQEYPADWFNLDKATRRSWLEGDDLFRGQFDHLERLDRVCVAQVWAEVMGRWYAPITAYERKEITDTLARLPGWERGKKSMRFGAAYGVQKGYVRCN